jgi:polysaccharide biosynthesis PFTS motif protein
MSYASKRQEIFNQVLERMNRVSYHSKTEIRIIADRMMAAEFEAKFHSTHKFDFNQLSPSPFHFPFRVIFANLLKGLLVTAYAILHIAFKLKKDNFQPPDCLVYGLPDEIIKGNSSSKDLHQFLASQISLTGTSPPVNLLVQSRTLKGLHPIDGVRYARDIGTSLLDFSNLNRFQLASQILKNFFKWLYFALSRPEITFIGREYIIESILAASKLECKIEYLITTQSTMLCLPSSFDHFPEANKIMFWYSDNSQQIKTAHIDPQETADYTYLQENSINLHFVWTESWATILRRYTSAEVRAIGPIIFKQILRVPRTNLNKPLNPARCLIFDVTPKQALSASGNFYAAENVTRFVSDILETLKSMSTTTQIDLKPKRPYTKMDSKQYVEFLTANSSQLRLLSPIQDIQELIANYDLVICIPYTSPAIIAKHLGVSTIYYSPKSDFKLEHMYENIQVTEGRDELLIALTGFLL